MSYANPTSWTDVDSAGNALSWSSRSGKMRYPALEMIRLAVLERADACGHSGIASVVQLAAMTDLGGNTLLSRTFCDYVDTAIDDMIPSYLDHTAGIVWETAITPWTEADILTVLGEGRVTRDTTSGKLPLAAWSLQVYKILNLLRWSWWPGTSGSGCECTLTGTKKELVWAVGDGYNAGKVAFEVASWGASGETQVWADVQSDGSDWTFHRNRTNLTIDAAFDCACTVHAYGILSRGLFGGSYDIDVYANDGANHSATEDELFLLGENTMPSDTWSSEDMGTFGDYEECPKTSEPGDTQMYGYTCRTSAMYVVTKFDGSGGFAFRDW